MKKLFSLLPLAVMVLLAGCEPDPEAARAPSNDLSDQAAFILGHNIGEGIHMQIEDLEGRDTQLSRDAILAGFRAGLRGDSLTYSQAEIDSIMVEFEFGVMQRAGAASRAEGDAYVAEFEQRDEVVATQSGLRYRVIDEGEGEQPGPTDLVTIHYEGRTPDGNVFDSSRRRGEPATLPVDGVVEGFAEALQLMRPGSRYEVVIPPDLGYGDQAPPVIGPGRTLIFDIELIDVQQR